MNSGVIKEGRSRRRCCSKGEDGRSRVSVNCARRWVSANENKGGSDRREGGGRKNKISCCLKLQAAQPRDANVDCSFPTLWPIRAPPNSLPWRPSHTCAIAINNQHRDSPKHQNSLHSFSQQSLVASVFYSHSLRS